MRMERIAVHDISVTLGIEAATYPGDVPFERVVQSTLAQGASFELSNLTMSAHAGTHIDAPAHVVAGGRTLDGYPASAFVLPALRADVAGAAIVRPEHLASVRLQNGKALLLRTDNSRAGRSRSPIYTERYVSIAPAAAVCCVTLGAMLVGIDYLSVDAADDATLAAHHILLEAGVLILEGIDLSQVQPGRYLLVCLPLKMVHAEASPVRAVLLSGVAGSGGA
jgi:arylformamidase